MMPRFLLPYLLFAVLLSASQALGQAYGLAARPAFTAYNNGALPTNAPVFSGSWSTVPAFANVTFYNALGITELPGQASNARRMVVWEREGKIYSFPKSTTATNAEKLLMLDISAKCQGWDDSGLLGLAFHPNFGTGAGSNRYVFIYYTFVTPGTVQGNPTARPPTFKANRDRLARFTVNLNGTIDTASETIFIDQIAGSVWHNGGGMFFHPDNGFLYLTNGDDADAPTNTQRLDRGLFSGVLRIDVDQRGGSISKPISRTPLPTGSITQNYYIPLDNPFVGQANVLEEFYCLGLRSPHRMTIDPQTKRIFIGDVGLGSWEEIDVIEPSESALNFQWSRIEGLNGDLTQPYLGVNKRPIVHYSHSEGGAVIGGYVYRGSEFASDLGGRYIFGDNVSGTIWYLDESSTPPVKVALTQLPDGVGPVSGADYVGLSSFGVDLDGELYLCQMASDANSGRIYKLSRSGSPPVTLPPTLSATGVFSSLSTLTPATGFTGYDVQNPLWSDRAHKTRWFAIPTGQSIGFAATGEWAFPQGSVYVKHFELPIDDTNPNVRKRLETRLLVSDDAGRVYGMTYKWRADNSDADLITAGETEEVAITGSVNLGTMTSTDIGGPAMAGTTTPVNGGWNVTAGGSDIFGTSDQFRFVHTQKTGDFDIATRVEAIDRADLYTKVGLMARESLAANSRNVMALLFPTNEARNNNTGGYEFQHRSSTGGASAAIYPAAPQPQVRLPNAWLRLSRVGNVFTAYHSKDGESWTAYAQHTLALPSTVYFGMAVTSHNTGALATAKFQFHINRTQAWYYPGRQDCLACHTNTAGGVLGLHTAAQNGNRLYPETGITDNQLRALNHVGYFTPALQESSIASLLRMEPLHNTAVSAETRIRSYLDSNCSHCHRPSGVHAFWDGRFETAIGSAGIINGIVQDNLGINNAKALAPQSVDRSILYKRIATATEHYKMPPLAKNVVDQSVLPVLEQWIAEASQPPADPLPSPWVHGDIGNVGFTGDATYASSTSTFIMSASGDDIWNTADAFHYTYQTLSGDGEVIARVQSITPTDPYTKAGVMIRDTLAAGSKEVFMTLTSAQGSHFQYRAATNGQSTDIKGPVVNAPYYVRIRRQGDVITGFIAATPGAWQQVGSVTLAMNSSAYIGLALTAHNNAQTATALFDNVSIRPAGLPLELNINFQTATAPIPDGYLPDTGAAFGARSGGYSYGWSADNTADARDRNNAASPDQRYDTLNHMQRVSTNTAKTWQIALPNGTYNVHLVAGDPLVFDSTHRVDAEGTALLSGAVSAASPWVEGSADIVVSDGALTLSQGSGGSNTKLCYLDITAVTGAVSVVLTSPAHQSTHYGAAASAVEFAATANTSTAGASISKVEFYQGLTLLGEDTSAPYAFTWNAPPTGTHRVLAKAIDSASGIGFSSFADIIVSSQGAFGLEAEYYPNISLSGTPSQRIDANVQFDWAAGSPMAGIPNDNFSVRWRGRVQAPVTGTYSFITESDDGVRLWVNGQLLINKWINQGTTRYTGTIDLTAGQLYDVELHYFDNSGNAIARLLWSATAAGLAEAVIPATAFFNPTAVSNHRPRTPDITLPAAESELSDPIVLTLRTAAFQDLDVAQTHSATDWEIWTTGASPERVWSALAQTGPALVETSLTAGNFEGSLAGATQLLNSTSYQLRVRHQDSSASTSNEWSAYATRGFVTTAPDDARGVTGEYYAGSTRLAGTPATRTDGNINFNWGNGSPGVGTVGADNFSVRWRARIKPQFSEVYTFTTESDDGARLWVNGQLLVDKWVGQGTTRHSGQIELVANQYYDLEMHYLELLYGANVMLKWSSASQPEQIVPALRLYAIAPGANHRPLTPSITLPAADGSVLSGASLSMSSSGFEDQDAGHTHVATDWEIWTDEANPTRVWSALNQTDTAKRLSVTLADGTFEGSHTGRSSLIDDHLYKLRVRHKDSSAATTSEWSAPSDWRSFTAGLDDGARGLEGEYYYNTQSFGHTTPHLRTDAAINFNWGTGEPFAFVGWDNFTVRWRGQVKPEFSETYTFKVTSDDGARVFVNGQLIIDQFVYQGTVSHTGSIALTAGQKYEIEVHYLEGSGDALVSLSWSSPSLAEQIVPASRLYLPEAGSNRRPRSPVIVLPSGAGAVSASALALQTTGFMDLDATQTHSATDWEIWTTGASLARVWSAMGQTGAKRTDVTLADGTFTGSHASRPMLEWSTSYQLRVCFRDSSGSTLSQTSAPSFVSFATSAAPWASWLASKFTLAEQGNASISGDDADPDRDGLNNLAEYAFGLEPKTANPQPLSPVTLSPTQLQITYPRSLAAEDAIIRIETSTSLEANDWSATSTTYEVLSTASGIQTIRATVTRQPGDTRRFIRAVAERY